MGAFPHVGRVANGFHWRDDAGSPARPPPDREAPVPVVSMKEILDRAFAERYGVAAINIVNDLTIEAVLAAAGEERAPVILQTSVKTVRRTAGEQLFEHLPGAGRGTSTVPVTLHLDHCPDRAVITRLPGRRLELGALRRPRARRRGEPARRPSRWSPRPAGTARTSRARSRASRASRTASARTRRPVQQSLEVAVDFIKRDRRRLLRARPSATRTASTSRAPTLDAQRVSDLVAATGVPMALHGGTGLSRRPVPAT